MTEFFDLSFRFYPTDLAKSDETTPIIRWWSSTIRDYRRGVVDSEPILEWEEFTKQRSSNGEGGEENDSEGISTTTRSKAIRVQVPLDLSNLRIDDAIGMELIVQSPNHENKLVGARCGSSTIILYNVHKILTKSQNSDGKYTSNHHMVLRTLGQAFMKGYLEISLLNGKHLRDRMKFDTTSGNMFSMIPYNRRNLSTLVYSFVLKDMLPYNEASKNLGIYFEPSSEDVSRIQAPLWVNVETVPGLFYWVDYSPVIPDEAFMSNAAKIALDRDAFGSKEFVDVVDLQFNETGSTYHDSFNSAVRVTVEMLCLLANSLRYKSDETFIPKREGEDGGGGQYNEEEEEDYTGRDHVSHKVSVEAFNDAYMLKGGDCEDLGNLIHRISRMLEVGLPEYRSDSVLHRKRGGWSDPVLDRMQMIAHIYVGGGALGSVTSRYLGEEEEKKQKQPKKKHHKRNNNESDDDEEDDREEERALVDPSTYVPHKNDPIIIDSERDMNAEFGGHMWWEWHPLKWFEECIHRTNHSVSPKFSLYPNEKRRPWEDNLPVAIGEGTGYMDPLMKPLECYNSSQESKEQAKEFMERKSEFFMCFAKRFMAKNKVQSKMGNFATQDTDNARLSKFYRKSSSFFTDKFMIEGFTFGKFTWTILSGERLTDEEYREKEVQKHGGITTTGEGGWRWGVNMRDRVFKRKYLGLIVSLGYTEQELKAVKSILRQFLPLKCPNLPSDCIKLANRKYEKMVNELSDRLKEAANLTTSTTRDEDDEVDFVSSNDNIYPYHVILRDNDIVDEKLKNRLVKSVSKIARGMQSLANARDKYGNRDTNDEDHKKVKLRYRHKIAKIFLKVEALTDDIVNVRFTMYIKSKGMQSSTQPTRRLFKYHMDDMVDDGTSPYTIENLVQETSEIGINSEQEIIVTSPVAKKIEELQEKHKYLVVLNWQDDDDGQIDAESIEEDDDDEEEEEIDEAEQRRRNYIYQPARLTRESTSQQKQQKKPKKIFHAYTFHSEDRMNDFIDFMDNHIMKSDVMIEGGVLDKARSYKEDVNRFTHSKTFQTNVKELHKVYENVKNESKHRVISLVSKFKKVPAYVYKSPVYKRALQEKDRASKYAKEKYNQYNKKLREKQWPKLPDTAKLPADYFYRGGRHTPNNNGGNNKIYG